MLTFIILFLVFVAYIRALNSIVGSGKYNLYTNKDNIITYKIRNLKRFRHLQAFPVVIILILFSFIVFKSGNYIGTMKFLFWPLVFSISFFLIIGFSFVMDKPRINFDLEQSLFFYNSNGSKSELALEEIDSFFIKKIDSDEKALFLSTKSGVEIKVSCRNKFITQFRYDGKYLQKMLNIPFIDNKL